MNSISCWNSSPIWNTCFTLAPIHTPEVWFSHPVLSYMTLWQIMLPSLFPESCNSALCNNYALCNKMTKYWKYWLHYVTEPTLCNNLPQFVIKTWTQFVINLFCTFIFFYEKCNMAYAVISTQKWMSSFIFYSIVMFSLWILAWIMVSQNEFKKMFSRWLLPFIGQYAVTTLIIYGVQGFNYKWLHNEV